jgi:hypothetical protein
MTFIPVPGGVKIVFRFILRGQPVTIGIYITTQQEINQAYLTTLANTAVNWWTGGGKNAFSVDLFLAAVEATQQSVQNGLQVIVGLDPLVNGTVANEAVPNQVALVVSLRTAQIGRSFRGRVYLPGLADNQVIGSNVSGVTAAAFKSTIDGLFTNLTVVGAIPVVVSRFANKVPRVTAVATPIITTLVSTRVDTQRRRLPDA